MNTCVYRSFFTCYILHLRSTEPVIYDFMAAALRGTIYVQMKAMCYHCSLS